MFVGANLVFIYRQSKFINTCLYKEYMFENYLKITDKSLIYYIMYIVRNMEPW